jgi:hypothetical protein
MTVDFERAQTSSSPGLMSPVVLRLRVLCSYNILRVREVCRKARAYIRKPRNANLAEIIQGVAPNDLFLAWLQMSMVEPGQPPPIVAANVMALLRCIEGFTSSVDDSEQAKRLHRFRIQGISTMDGPPRFSCILP